MLGDGHISDAHCAGAGDNAGSFAAGDNAGSSAAGDNAGSFAPELKAGRRDSESTTTSGSTSAPETSLIEVPRTAPASESEKPFKGCCPWFNFDDEPRGFVYLCAARGGPSIFAGLFANVALNDFSYAVADCDGMVLNGALKASSIVASVGVVGGIATAILSPVVGTMSDLSPHRKRLMGLGYLVLLTSILLQALLSLSTDSDKVDPEDPENMLPRPLAQSGAALMVFCAAVVIKSLAYESAALLSSTFAPELSTDDIVVARYVGYAFLCMNGSQLFCAIVIIAVAMGAGLNAFQQATVGGFFVLVYCLCWLVPGYRLMEPRSLVNPELKRSCCGAMHIWETLVETVLGYPQLAKFFASWSFANAASTSVSVLATSYLQNYLGFSGVMTSALLALALLFSVPGSLIVPRLSHKLSLKTIYVTLNVGYGLTFLLAPIIFMADEVLVNDPNATQTYTYYGFCDDDIETEAPDETAQEARGYVLYLVIAFCCIWGILLGGIYSASTSLFSSLVPGGKEATFFSLKVTTANVLTWMPSLLYAAINESGSPRWAIAPLGPVFLAAALLGSTVSVAKAKQDIKHTLHRRQGKIWGARKASLDSVEKIVEKPSSREGQV